jgi:hypothetical protein
VGTNDDGVFSRIIKKKGAFHFSPPSEQLLQPRCKTLFLKKKGKLQKNKATQKNKKRPPSSIPENIRNPLRELRLTTLNIPYEHYFSNRIAR